MRTLGLIDLAQASVVLGPPERAMIAQKMLIDSRYSSPFRMETDQIGKPQPVFDMRQPGRMSMIYTFAKHASRESIL